MHSKIDITSDYLKTVEERMTKSGYTCPKWILYCREVLKTGLRVKLYDSKSTVSKYIYSSNGKKVYKVRFSNHKPNKIKETINDCNFFVGVTNYGVTRTEDALKATFKFFNVGIE